MRYAFFCFLSRFWLRKSERSVTEDALGSEGPSDGRPTTEERSAVLIDDATILRYIEVTWFKKEESSCIPCVRRDDPSVKTCRQPKNVRAYPRQDAKRHEPERAPTLLTAGEAPLESADMARWLVRDLGDHDRIVALDGATQAIPLPDGMSVQRAVGRLLSNDGSKVDLRWIDVGGRAMISMSKISTVDEVLSFGYRDVMVSSKRPDETGSEVWRGVRVLSRVQ